MQFRDHDNLPEFDHRALPPAEGSGIGELPRRRAFQAMPRKARRHENWGYISGVYDRRSRISHALPWSVYDSRPLTKVTNNRESQRRRYALVERVRSLGWDDVQLTSAPKMSSIDCRARLKRRRSNGLYPK